MKKIVLLIVVLVMSIVTACSNANSKTPEGAEKDLIFAYSIMSLDNPYFIAVQKGFEERAKELGIKTIVNDAKYDATTQLNQVENYITQNVNAIAVSPVDQKGLEASFEKAKEKDIFTVGQAQPVDNADSNLIVNEYEYGVAIGTNAAKWINEKLKGEAEVLIISQDNVETVQARANGIEDSIKELAPNAKIVARQTGDTPELAMGITENVLQSNPNVNVIVAVNDSAGIGAYEAVKAANKGTAEFYIGAADATEQALSKMKEKESIYRSTIDIDPYGTGKKLVDMMLKAVKGDSEGETVYFDLNTIWQDEVE